MSGVGVSGVELSGLLCEFWLVSVSGDGAGVSVFDLWYVSVGKRYWVWVLLGLSSVIGSV